MNDLIHQHCEEKLFMPMLLIQNSFILTTMQLFRFLSFISVFSDVINIIEDKAFLSHISYIWITRF